MYARLTLALLAVLAAGANGQYDSSVFNALSNPPVAAANIDTQYWFPEHASLQFPAGDTIEALVGVSSSSSETYNVSAVFGSLNNPALFSNFFYNFTPQGYQRTLGPGEELALSYSFWIPHTLPAREFQVALTVFYGTDKEYFSSTFFNKTIDVVDKPKWIDTELLFLGLLFAGLAAGLGYVAYAYVSSLGYVRKQKSRRAPKRVAPVAESSSDEWLKGTHFAQGPNVPVTRKSSKGDVRKGSPMRGAIASDK